MCDKDIKIKNPDAFYQHQNPRLIALSIFSTLVSGMQR